MTKRNRESGVPQEAREPKVGKVEENKKVEVWADKGTSEDSTAKANRLFDQMKKDLREKRAEAKKEGKSEADIKAIRFDKNSDVYKEWISACSDNTYEDLDKRESELHAKLEKAQEAGEDVEKSGLYDQWERVSRKLGTVSAARRIRKELDIKLTSIEDRIGDLTEKSGRLGGDNLPIESEVVALGGEIDVVNAQRSVIDTLAVNPDDVVELPPPFTFENISESNGSELEEILEEVDPRLTTVEGEFFGVEASSGGRGAEKIRSVFSKELAKDEKAKIGFREAVFTQKLNQYVGDDEAFADMLLKNGEFKGAVNDFFNAKIGPFGNKAMEKAARFIYILEIARSIYDQQKTEMSRKKAEISQNKGVSFVDNETVSSSLVEHAAVERFFSSFGKESGIKNPGKLKGEVDKMKSDMNVKKADLEIQQDTLKKCKWYELNKKSQLKDKIKSLNKDIDGLFGALVHLGEQITNDDVKSKLLADSDLSNLNTVLADQIKVLKADVKSGKEKIGSADFFDRFAELSAVLAALAVMFSVAMAARSEGKAKPQRAAETEMASVMEEVTPETEEAEAPVGGEREATQPKDFDLGITALPGFVESETPSVVRKSTRGARHAETKSGSSADAKLTYEEQMKKFDDQIESQRRYVRSLEAHKGASTTPILDIENLGKEDKTSPVWHENTIAKAEAKILELEAAKRAYSLKKHQDDISREDKVPGAGPKVHKEVERQVDYQSLDFSRPYVGNLGTAHDLVREVHELAKVAKPRQLEGLKNKLRDALASSQHFRGEKNHTEGDIEEAKRVETVAQKMLDDVSNNRLGAL